MIGEQQRRVDVERRVRRELERIGLYRLPVNPVQVANRLGMKVRGAEFTDDSIISVITTQDHGIGILVADAETPYRKRFAVAHALGHYFIHLKEGRDITDAEKEIVDRKSYMFFRRGEPVMDFPPKSRIRRAKSRSHSKYPREEIEANWFATELLMPEKFFRKEWDWRESVWRLARVFNVTEEAIEYRLKDLGL